MSNSSGNNVKNTTIFSYGFLALPLAFMGMPIYVFLQSVYNESYGVNLWVIGLILMLCRLIDTIQDPIFGIVSDRLVQKGFSRKKIISFASPLLIISFYFLFLPPFDEVISLVIFLILTFSLFSLIMINYYSIAVEINKDYDAQTKIVSGREIFTVLGLVTAITSTSLLSQNLGSEQTYQIISAGLALCFLIALILLHFTKLQKREKTTDKFSFNNIKNILKNETKRKFLLVIFLSASAAALPATTIIFFVNYVLEAKAQTPYFLITYFFFGIIFMPFWVFLSKKIGKKNTWFTGMIIAVISFLWAFFITPETAYLFYIICALTGGAYGADLSIPPALYADMVDDVNEGGIYFAILNFINKFSLAIGAGIGLLIPGILGFDSAAGNASSASTNQQDFSVTSIAVVYCLIPCAFKLLSAILLKRGDFDKAYKN